MTTAQAMLELADELYNRIAPQRFAVENLVSKDLCERIIACLRASQPAAQAPEPVAWRRRRKGIAGNGGWIMCPEKPERDSEFDLEPLYVASQAFECCKGLAPVADCRCEQEHRDTRADIFRSALLDIKSAHVPDQPPYSQASETTWVLQHVAMIRRIASKALDEANVRGQAPAGTGGDRETAIRAFNAVYHKSMPFHSGGERTAAIEAGIDAIIAALTSMPGEAVSATDPLTDLVTRFSAALLDKLRVAEERYRWNNGWLEDGWKESCLRQFNEHIAKGDPRDVAAYCAFMWHHNWPTAAVPSEAIGRELPQDLPADVIAAVVGGGITSDQVTKVWGLIRAALQLRDMTGSAVTRPHHSPAK